MEEDLKEQRILSFVQENATRGDPQSVVDTIDKYCRNVEWAMHVGDEKGLIVDKVVLERDPSVVLELGTYCGYSAIRIAHLLKPGSRLFTLELNPVHAAVSKQMIEFAGVQDKVKVLEGSTGTIIPQLKEKYNVDALDFVFLDHSKELYTPDTKLLEKLSLKLLDDKCFMTKHFQVRPAPTESVGASLSEGAPIANSISHKPSHSVVIISQPSHLSPRQAKILPKNVHYCLQKCRLLKEGSVLLADNVVYPGIPDFLEYVRTCGRYDCTNYPSHAQYMSVDDALEKAVFKGYL